MKEINLSSAQEFLNYLRPSNSHWFNGVPDSSQNWRFRGQANSEWSLEPTSFRRDKESGAYTAFDAFDIVSAPFINLLLGIDASTEAGRLELVLQLANLEVTLLLRFLETADTFGITTPLNEDIVRVVKWCATQIAQIASNETDSYTLHMPPEGLLDAFALAQHHGFPTRFLDWSYSPLVAAFFAAKEIFDKPEQTGNIALWALDIGLLQSIQGQTGNEDYPILGITTTYNNNQYIQAQKGYFTIDMSSDKAFLEKGVRKPQNEVIDGFIKKSQYKGFEVLRKITLPTSEAKNLLRLLYHEGVSPARLMPNLDNIKVEMKYRIDLFDELNDPFKERK